jgi:hypothetical protein
MRTGEAGWSWSAAGRLALRRVLLPGGRVVGSIVAALLVATRWLFAIAALGAFTMAQQEHGWQHTRFLLEAGAIGAVTLLGYRLRRR